MLPCCVQTSLGVAFGPCQLCHYLVMLALGQCWEFIEKVAKLRKFAGVSVTGPL